MTRHVTAATTNRRDAMTSAGTSHRGRTRGSRAVRALLATVGTAAVLAAGVVSGQTGAAAPEQLTWAALGDSISSGYGIASVSSAPSAWGAECARADGEGGGEAAMPVVAQRALAERGTPYRQVFTACVGAQTDDWAVEMAEAYQKLGVEVSAPVERGVPTRAGDLVTELNSIADGGNRFDLISFSFGANNVGLGAFGNACMDLGEFDGSPRSWTSSGWGGCDVPEQQVQALGNALSGQAPGQLLAGVVPLWHPDTAAGEVEPLLSAIGRFVEPGGTVLVMGYPQIVDAPERSVLARRWAGAPTLLDTYGNCNGLDRQAMTHVRDTITFLNGSIRQATRSANATWSGRGVTFRYVDLNEDLGFERGGSGHGICGPSPWINDAYSQVGPLHPNAEGHQRAGEALARLIAAG